MPPRGGADRTAGAQQGAQGRGESRTDTAARAEERGPTEKPKREHAAPEDSHRVPKEPKAGPSPKERPPRGKPPRKPGKKGPARTATIRATTPVRQNRRAGATERPRTKKNNNGNIRSERLWVIQRTAEPEILARSATVAADRVDPVVFAERLNHALPFSSWRCSSASCWQALCRRRLVGRSDEPPPRRGRRTGPSNSIGPACRICTRSTPGSIAAPSPRPKGSRNSRNSASRRSSASAQAIPTKTFSATRRSPSSTSR